MANTKRDQHKERLYVFREIQALLYTDNCHGNRITVVSRSPFRDISTKRISLSVYNFIKQIHGGVTSQKLHHQEEKFCQITFEPVNPIHWVFKVINELVYYTNVTNKSMDNQYGIYHPQSYRIFCTLSCDF